jgi:hypothetical protein
MVSIIEEDEVLLLWNNREVWYNQY